MYRRTAKLAASCGFSGGFAGRFRSALEGYDLDDNWPRPSGTGATSCQMPSCLADEHQLLDMDLALAGETAAQRSRAIGSAARACSSVSVFRIVRCGM